MTIIEIAALDNGAHNNQTIYGADPTSFAIPDGWAVLPESVGTPETLENYPFGDITADYSGEWPVVTSWTPLPIPEPEEPAEPQTSLDERVTALEDAIAAGLSL